MKTTIYYVAGMAANFHDLKDALYCAAEEANRTYENQSVMIDTGNQDPYIYCRITKGNQA